MARTALVSQTRQKLSQLDVEGLTLPSVKEGTVGIHARALGGASLPLSNRFLLRQSGASLQGLIR